MSTSNSKFELFTCHFLFLRRFTRKSVYLQNNDEIHLANTREMVKRELIHLIDTEDHLAIPTLSYYMKSPIMTDFIIDVIDSCESVKRCIIEAAWSCGNVSVLQNMLDKNIDIDASRYVRNSLRSSKKRCLALCLKNGGSLHDICPFNYIRTMTMLKALIYDHRCKLTRRITGFAGEKRCAMDEEYVRAGGFIAELGQTTNLMLQKQGNSRRTEPIKRTCIAVRQRNLLHKKSIVRCLASLAPELLHNICSFV